MVFEHMHENALLCKGIFSFLSWTNTFLLLIFTESICKLQVEGKYWSSRRPQHSEVALVLIIISIYLYLSLWGVRGTEEGAGASYLGGLVLGHKLLLLKLEVSGEQACVLNHHHKPPVVNLHNLKVLGRQSQQPWIVVDPHIQGWVIPK